MPTTAILRGSMEIPAQLVNVEEIRRALTLTYAPMGEEPIELETFWETEDAIHVPRQYGIDLCQRHGIPFEDHTSIGVEINFKKVPAPRDYQVDALDQLEGCLGDYYDFIWRARTGWGKTIGSLILASRLGTSTLVVVDQENLKDQWISCLMQHFGCTKNDIGIIQGDKCIYEGKAVTVAMVQTLSQRDYPQEVYDYFGLMIVDEVHVIGAPTFSRVLLQFSATHRMGPSATPKRRDGLQKVLDYSLGRVRVWIEDEHDPSAVYVAEHPTIYSEFANTSTKIGRFISEVSEDGSRNLLAAEAAAYLYDTGRDILVLSDRIEQLFHLESLCYYLGIPEEEMGLYTGYTLTYGYEKDPTPERKPAGLVKYEGDEENEPGYYYTPVRLSLISKKAKKQYLEKVKTKARIIWSTYGKFSKGVDEPRLCGGVDATPRSQSEQVQGRILRKLEGKLTPIWITIADTRSYRSLHGLLSRIADYLKNNATVSKWGLEEGKVKCDIRDLRADLYAEVKHLKSMQIVRDSDGLNTLMIRQQAKMRATRAETATTLAIVRRRGSPTACTPEERPERSSPGRWITR